MLRKTYEVLLLSSTLDAATRWSYIHVSGLYTRLLFALGGGLFPLTVPNEPLEQPVRTGLISKTNDKHHADVFYKRPYLCTTLSVKAPS
jgi:hypothetical protein